MKYRVIVALLLFFDVSVMAAKPDIRQLQDSAQLKDPTDLRQQVEALELARPAVLARQLLFFPEKVASFYHSLQHRAQWVGSPQAERRLTQLVKAIRQSADHGLPFNRYHLAALTSANTSELAKELLATDAFFAQAEHRLNGVVKMEDIDPEWYLQREVVDADKLLASAIANNSVYQALDKLWPRHKEYDLLLKKRAELLAENELESRPVTAGPLLKPGMSSGRVVELKERLYGPGEYDAYFDTKLQETVKSYQLASGLEPDGIVGADTLELLNHTRVAWIDRIDANLERWRWLPQELPATHIRVNIAAYQLWAFARGHEDFTMRIIAGRPYRRTPVFSETLKYMVINPYWTVPGSIAVKDKLPLLKADAKALDELGYQVQLRGDSSYIQVSSVNWSEVTPSNFDFSLRQKPGEKNALGKIKFMLPNRYSVYLHDTPDHTLFEKQERGFSSGCIRLSEPLELAEWLLRTSGQEKDITALRDFLGTGETVTLHLRNPVPVLILYMTAFRSDEGEIVFRKDLYQRDKPILDKLHEQ